MIRSPYRLCLSESTGEALHVLLQLTMVGEELDVCTINADAASGLLLQVLVTPERSEAPVLGDDDLLSAGELVLRTSESLEGDGTACLHILVQ